MNGVVRKSVITLNDIIPSGAGAHNAVYRGINLGDAVSDAQWAAIQAGIFDDMYIGSKMYTEGLEQAKNTINSAFGSDHVLNHRKYLCNAVTNGRPSDGSWYESTVDLMTEQNVYGGRIFGAGNDGSSVPVLYTTDKGQFPLFAFRPDLISNRTTFWLRDVVSAANFALVGRNGEANYYSASNASGVRPVFSIK